MKLYYAPNSSACRRVLAVAFHLQLPVELFELPAGDDSHPSAQRVKQLNPNGRVPVLEDGEYSLWESNAIMQYLCTRKIGQTLFPEEEKTRLNIARWQFWQLAHFGPACDELGARRAPGDGAADPTLLDSFREQAKLLDRHLLNRKYIVGDAVTLADFSIGSCLTHWQSSGMPLQEFKNLREWYSHLESTEAWKKSSPRGR
jgi:glutathione S-transferase